MFKDRIDAGRRLAESLAAFAGRRDVLVLALPRGGVVVAAEVAARLGAPLDALIVRKIGHPWQPELAIGAVAETGAVIYNKEVMSSWSVTEEYVHAELARQEGEIRRRQQLYRSGRALALVSGRTVIVVDDGIATGATMRAAIEALKRDRPRELITAVPVAPPDIVAELRTIADRFVCLEMPRSFLAVGNFYEDFPQVDDAEVVTLLDRFRLRAAA